MSDWPIAGRELTNVETNVPVSLLSLHLFRWTAEREKRSRAPRTHTVNGTNIGHMYHLRVERLRRFRWSLTAYHNILYPNSELPSCLCEENCGCLCPRHDQIPEHRNG